MPSRMDILIAELAELATNAGTRPTETGVPGLLKIKGDVPQHQLAALYNPMVGLVVRGLKTLWIGGRKVELKGPSYFVVPMHLPVTGKVAPSREGREYFSLGLELNQETLRNLLEVLPIDSLPTGFRTLDACAADEQVVEAWLRLLRLSIAPNDIPALAPVFEREILYRVLSGPQGWYLRQLAQTESPFSKIAETVSWLRENYREPFSIRALARKTGMALTTFHRQFKSATGLSPIQFQKQLRLLEARNLLAFEGHAVATAAYEVGYQSPSQFNREYSRFFGASPARDTAALRQIERARGAA